jgi:hypothetical protein
MFDVIKWLVASDITKHFTSRRSLVKQEGSGSASAFCTQRTPVTGMLHSHTVQGPSGRRPDGAPSPSPPSRLPPCGGLAGVDTAGPWRRHIALPPHMVLGAPSWRPSWLARSRSTCMARWPSQMTHPAPPPHREDEGSEWNRDCYKILYMWSIQGVRQFSPRDTPLGIHPFTCI